MEHFDEFRFQFTEHLSEAAQALEENGYDLEENEYSVYIGRDGFDTEYVERSSDPEEALDGALAEATEGGRYLTFSIPGEKVLELMKGNKSAERFLQKQLKGGVDIHDPSTEADWLEDRDYDYSPAFGTTVDFVPDFPEEYFRLRTIETLPPYSYEDARERLGDIKEILESRGFEAEIDRVG